jgi:hypothetical protein
MFTTKLLSYKTLETVSPKVVSILKRTSHWRKFSSAYEAQRQDLVLSESKESMQKLVQLCPSPSSTTRPLAEFCCVSYPQPKKYIKNSHSTQKKIAYDQL